MPTKQIREAAGVTPTYASRPKPEVAGGLLRRLPHEPERAGLDPILARSGALEARLALGKKEVRRAQKLRYRVFFEEGGAVPDPNARVIGRDICRYDRVCDHLIVVDTTLGQCGSPEVVGACRLLRQDVAERNFGFYSACEFDVAALIARRPTTRFLEVGRACVASSHRGKHALELLWRGLWAYALRYGADAMIGCASMPGADPARHAGAIRALASHPVDPSWRVASRPDRAAPLGQSESPLADPRALVRELPPLVKGYWRLGAIFSPIPVVDPAFNTTDVFVAMPLCDVEERYLHYFGVPPAPLAA